MSSTINETAVVMPHLMIQSHTDWVHGIVHLHDGCHIITFSMDGPLRLCDLESGRQIGEDWQDVNGVGIWSMTLSPNGRIVASGCGDGKVRLWNVETRKVIAKWEGHTHVVGALSWSADGNQVLSGSWDGTARVWDVKSGKTVLTIKAGHKWVNAVIYSPDATKIATGGDDENAIKIWDARTGKLFKTLKHQYPVWSLAWTSDGKKLFSGSYGPIRMFDTAAWNQIAILEGHTKWVNAISLSGNERLLASASVDTTVRLWNLNTNLQVTPLLRHGDAVQCAAFSLDGNVLVTGCQNSNIYTWDIYAVLKEVGLQYLLPPGIDIVSMLTYRSRSLTDNVCCLIRHPKTTSNRRHLKAIRE